MVNLLPVSLLGISNTKHCDAANKFIADANSCDAAPVVVEQLVVSLLMNNIFSINKTVIVICRYLNNEMIVKCYSTFISTK